MNPVFKCIIVITVVSGYVLNTEAMGVCGFHGRYPVKIPESCQSCKNKTNTSTFSPDVTQTGTASKTVSHEELMTTVTEALTTTTADETNTTMLSPGVTNTGTSSEAVSYEEELMTSAKEALATTTAGSFETSTYPPCPHNKVNESFVNENCTKRCVCNDTGGPTCSNYSCPDNSTCGVEDGVRECYCDAGFIKLEKDCWRPAGCHDLYSAGITYKGVYIVYPKYWPDQSMQVYCDGGWTVFQRRINGSVDFYRNWTEYKEGFGRLNHEFWFGNEKLYYLTNQYTYELRIELLNDAGKYSVLYTLFRIENEDAGYRLSELGDFIDTGVENDCLTDHVNASFSTYDRDMDLSSGENCAEVWQGGWWFTNCHLCYLNGVYGESAVPGSRWYGLPGGQFNIKTTEMKIRPR